MKQFKSANDLLQLAQDDPAYPIVANLVKRLIVDYEAEGWTHDPDADGWICLIEREDLDRPLNEIWDDWTLFDIPWEGITKDGDHYIAVFLANNQFGLAFVIPDAPWLTPAFRNMIEENLDPPFAETTTA